MPTLRSELDASRGWSGCVKSRGRKHSVGLVYFEGHDIRRILVADMNEVTSWIEIEMPRCATLCVDPANYAQLKISRIDRADHDVIVAPVGTVQKLSSRVDKDLAGTAVASEPSRKRAQVFLHWSQVAITVPKIGVEGIGELIDRVDNPTIRMPRQVSRAGSGWGCNAAHLSHSSHPGIERINYGRVEPEI